MNNALLADNNPYEALAELIESESEKVRQSSITIKNYYHQIGDHLFAKFQEFAQPGVKKKEAEKKIKQFIDRTYPAKKYDADFRANISKFLKFSTKISKLDKPLQERIMDDTSCWDEAAIAALLEIKPELIPEALNNWKDSIPQGNEIRKWKRKNAPSSLEMDKKFDEKDLEITQSKFNLNPEESEQIVLEAQARRIEELRSKGVDLSLVDTSPLTNDVIGVLAEKGFKVGKFGRYSRQSKKLYTEAQLKLELVKFEKKVTHNIVDQIKSQIPQLAHLEIKPLLSETTTTKKQNISNGHQQIFEFPNNNQPRKSA